MTLLRPRTLEDSQAVLALLEAAQLPAAGLEQTEGWVLEDHGVLVGHVAVEPTEDALVVRSLVVAPTHRGHHLGARLMDQAESLAAGRPLILKTDTVGAWMLRRGYRRIHPDAAPPHVRHTTQFSGALCASTPIFLKESTMNPDTLKAAVRERYAEFVSRNSSCCGPKSACGCSGNASDPSLKVGYAAQDLAAVPEGSNLGLGCGNPVALAALRPGDVVLDLGSGAGFDAFLASKRVGPEGRVIGVDMTPAMLERARDLAKKHGYTNVTFRQGDIEHLPVDADSVDVVISNCVINLTPDKPQAFREAFRVLRPGGRLMVSDLVLLKPLPETLRQNMNAYAACLAGALLKDSYLAAIAEAGFADLTVVGESRYDLGDPDLAEVADQLSDGTQLTAAELKLAAEAVVSIQIEARKPR